MNMPPSERLPWRLTEGALHNRGDKLSELFVPEDIMLNSGLIVVLFIYVQLQASYCPVSLSP
jgi:hypothetical protein